MHRRAVLGTLAAGFGTLVAGCSQSRVDGEVASNETPLTFSHEYATQGTLSGTRVVVQVPAENDGNEAITLEESVPRVVCTFLDGSGNPLHQSGLELTRELDVGETVDLEFTLAVDVDEVTRYRLRSEWIED